MIESAWNAWWTAPEVPLPESNGPEGLPGWVPSGWAQRPWNREGQREIMRYKKDAHRKPHHGHEVNMDEVEPPVFVWMESFNSMFFGN